MSKIITKTIMLLSLVSLFTDIASEMLYPVMPVFLKSIGYSVLFIGILEGVAEAVAGFSKGYFGSLSDITGKRIPFIRFGYALSAISKPMIVMIISPFWILFGRTLDRLGKGIRTAARDAILSGETFPENKGEVFGFHRAFDTIGAAIGPGIALIYLSLFPGEYITLFYIAFIPGVLSVTLTFLLKENKKQEKSFKLSKPGFFTFIKFGRTAPTEYKRLVAGLLAFALINSSDVFLLLMAKHRGFDDKTIIIFYIFYNLVYALFSRHIGKLGDRIGLKPTFCSGLGLFAIVYACFAFNGNIYFFMFLFFLYGIYASATEGISKAWLTNIVPGTEAATAIGYYTGFQSIATLLASTIAGFLWFSFRPELTFIFSSVSAVIIMFYIIFKVKYFKAGTI